MGLSETGKPPVTKFLSGVSDQFVVDSAAVGFKKADLLTSFWTVDERVQSGEACVCA